ncbi:hypothetical protein ACFLTP_04535 [Chloroflexota bacterium]
MTVLSSSAFVAGNAFTTGCQANRYTKSIFRIKETKHTYQGTCWSPENNNSRPLGRNALRSKARDISIDTITIKEANKMKKRVEVRREGTGETAVWEGGI